MRPICILELCLHSMYTVGSSFHNLYVVAYGKILHHTPSLELRAE